MFNEKGNLKTHFIRIHCGENPYKCQFEGCTEAFKSHVHLKDHIKRHQISSEVKQIKSEKNVHIYTYSDSQSIQKIVVENKIENLTNKSDISDILTDLENNNKICNSGKNKNEKIETPTSLIKNEISKNQVNKVSNQFFDKSTKTPCLNDRNIYLFKNQYDMTKSSTQIPDLYSLYNYLNFIKSQTDDNTRIFLLENLSSNLKIPLENIINLKYQLNYARYNSDMICANLLKNLSDLKQVILPIPHIQNKD
jgi:hypothetical protein